MINQGRDEIRGRRVLILGYGVEGRAVHHFLNNRYPELKISIADQNNDPDYLKLIPDNDTIVRSPGISPETPELVQARARGQRVTSATNIFFKHKAGRVIGVTGTKGKSTTASLIAAILSRKFSDVRLGGNIGRPLLELLAGAAADTIFVAELSSFQLVDARFSPEISVVLQIAPDHLDYHGSFAAYQAAKSNIFAHHRSGDLTVLHSLHPLREQIHSQVIGFGNRGDIVFAEEDSVFYGNREELIAQRELNIRGSGNLQNIMAAAAVGLQFGVPPKDIKAALGAFNPLPYRLEPIGAFRGIRFINDSLATQPEAMLHAVEAFRGELGTLIAGGFDRGLDFSHVGPRLLASTLEQLILLPTTGAKIYNSINASAQTANFSIHQVQSLRAAVACAYEVTKPGRVCLLSPGAASFNMFRDYKERGDAFKSLVSELGAV